eukprot:3343965-Pyramimonas_sp.AAC.1
MMMANTQTFQEEAVRELESRRVNIDQQYQQKWAVLASEQPEASTQAVRAAREADDKHRKWETQTWHSKL